MKKIAVLILAAGKSSRMGTIKQLLKVDGKTLLETTIETAKKTNLVTIFCVLGSNSEKIKQEIKEENVNFILNENHELGLSSSIVLGVKFIEKQPKKIDGILILLADQPTVNSTYISKMTQLFEETSEKIIVSSYPTKKGVPAIFPRSYFEELKVLKGDIGAGKLLKKYALNCVEVLQKITFIDLDTPEEYQKYIAKR